MDVRLNRVELLHELVPMQGIVERRTTIPVLSHLLLRAEGDRLHLAATNLEVSLTSSCDAEVKAEGVVAIQARKLVEIVKACSDDEMALLLDDANSLTILAGPAKFKIRGLPAEDFPTLPTLGDAPEAVVPFPIFRSMIGRVFFAISHEESRYQLNGALLQQGGDAMTLVATDGHRLALVESALEDAELPTGEAAGGDVLVPRKALQELQRFESDGPMRFRRSDHHLSFTVERRQLICRVLDGTFPDYERVIAQDNNLEVSADRRMLQGVVQRVSLLTGERSRAVRLALTTDTLTLSAVNPDLGEATEDLPCTYGGGDLSLGINPDYLRDFLGAVTTDEIKLTFKDENSQCLAMPVDGPDRRYVYVIMPIRL
ncbi:MAG: DNA polymerase III subunit beta [Acidobacteriota bacterium]